MCVYIIYIYIEREREGERESKELLSFFLDSHESCARLFHHPETFSKGKESHCFVKFQLTQDAPASLYTNLLLHCRDANKFMNSPIRFFC